MNIHPYLCFEGRTEEALTFYKKAIGAEVSLLMRFGEMPDPSQCEPHLLDKVMHATVKVGNTLFMVSDGRATGEAEFKGITLSLTVASLEEAEQVFARLADGGQAMMPLEATFWSPGFGMLMDRFGVTWMVNVELEEDDGNQKAWQTG